MRQPSHQRAAQEQRQPKSSTATALAKDAMSLVEFPIALITTRALPADETTVIFRDRDRSVTIAAPARPSKSSHHSDLARPDQDDDFYGLPTPVDDEVILALIQLTKN